MPSKQLSDYKHDPPTYHMLKIASDTVKHPMKALLGGPSVEQARETLTSHGITEAEASMIFVDMDGVLVDFNAGAMSVFGHDELRKRQASKSETDKIMALGEKFWRDLPPMPGFDTLWNWVDKHDAHILSARAAWEAPGQSYSYAGKMKWIKQHLNISISRVHIVRRSEKQIFATAHNTRNILIDDLTKNIREWEAHRGIGIHHKTVPDTIQQLRKLVN